MQQVTEGSQPHFQSQAADWMTLGSKWNKYLTFIFLHSLSDGSMWSSDHNQLQRKANIQNIQKGPDTFPYSYNSGITFVDNSGIPFVDLFVTNETIHNSKILSLGLLITKLFARNSYCTKKIHHLKICIVNRQVSDVFLFTFSHTNIALIFVNLFVVF